MATYYISPTGNDSTGDGSSGNPWATITKFIASSAQSDTCICKDGTYTHETGAYTVTDRTIQAENSGLALFNGGNNTSFRWRGGGTINFTGIEFYNYVVGDFYPIFGSTNETAAGTWTFTNCVWRDCTVQNDQASTGGLFGAFARDGSSQSFVNCVIYQIAHEGAAGGYAGLFKGNALLTITFTGGVIALNTSSNHLVTIMDSQLNAKYTVTMTNLAISNFTGGTVTMSSRTLASQTNTNCAFYNMSAGNGSVSGTNIVTADPAYIDYANNNFNLQVTSPLRAAGATP